jgi:uncharacterized membrane protein YbhN (UPF0104 family)
MEKEEIINETEEVSLENNQENNEPKEKKKHPHIKYMINIVLVFGLTIASLFISLGANFEKSFSILGDCQWIWVLVMFLIMLGATALRSFILFLFARLYTRDYKLHQAFAVESIGNFYSAVTPGATGGQVMEAYTFSKQGIKTSNAFWFREKRMSIINNQIRIFRRKLIYIF